MENLNAENVKKALECCTIWGGCDNCPFEPKGDCYKGSMECGNELMKNTLALINSQEQRIKELAVEVASWKEISEGYQKQFEDCAEDRARLTEENERLKADNEILKMPRATIFEIGDAFDRGRIKGRADTVRKMHSEINKTLSALCKGDVSAIHRIIDQIAKEMLEEII